VVQAGYLVVSLYDHEEEVLVFPDGGVADALRKDMMLRSYLSDRGDKAVRCCGPAEREGQRDMGRHPCGGAGHTAAATTCTYSAKRLISSRVDL